MVKFENNSIVIVFDKYYYSADDIVAFIDALLWYLSHIESDAYVSEHSYYLCELIRMMMPNDKQIKLKNEIHNNNSNIPVIATDTESSANQNS